MKLWLVRAGRRGEYEDVAKDMNLVIVGWEELTELSTLSSKESLLERLSEAYPQEKQNTLKNWQAQVWAFARTIEKGDLVALPLKGRPTIAIGQVVGDYEYRTDLPQGLHHARRVNWLKEIARDHIDQDLLFSFGAFMTVCRIQRNDAEKRIQDLVSCEGKPPIPSPNGNPTKPTDPAEQPDLEGLARDGIRRYVGAKFKGHELTQLVGAVLEAQGYRVVVAQAGPDGGVDIIAGMGALGFDQPRLAVQVKSQDSAVDVKVYRELKGVLKDFGAENGLLVAWGGFLNSVPKEAKHDQFKMRLWTGDDLIKAVEDNYERLTSDIQAKLPLKRTWLLVPEEE